MTTAAHDRYVELLSTEAPRPVRTEEEAETLCRSIDKLVATPDLSADESDYLTLLSELLEAWDRHKVELADPTLEVLIEELLAAHGLSQLDLVGPVFHTERAAAELMNGERGLTVDAIDRLARFFHVSPALFFPSRS